MTIGNLMLCTASYLRKYCSDYAKEFGLNFDTSAFDRYQNQDYWYIEDFVNKDETKTL